MSRRWLAKEVVQTSNMDCGVAGLKCILDSYGIQSNYEYLRDACKTDVNGTSIDRMEDVLNDIGFDSYQVVVPKEQLTYDTDALLPAIAVVNIGQNITHFVVIWRKVGNWLQICDPAQGRYWVRAKHFANNQLFIYRDHIETEQWQHCFEAWDRPHFLAQVKRKLGIGAAAFKKAMENSDTQWQPGAKVDAVLRFITYLADQDKKFTGKTAETLFNELLQAMENQPETEWYKTIPKAFWSCRTSDDWYTTAMEKEGLDASNHINFSGAVLLKVSPTERLKQPEPTKSAQPESKQQSTASETEDEASAETQAASETDEEEEERSGPEDEQIRQALTIPTKSPMRSVYEFVRTAGLISPTVVFLSAIVVGATVALQAMAFKLLFEFENLVAPGQLRINIALVIFFLTAGTAILNVPLQLTVQRISRRLEDQFRIALYEKLPRLKDEYFSSRLLSDLIERSHSVASIENIPSIMVNLIQTLTRLLVIYLGLIYLVPEATLWISLFTGACIIIPFIAQQILSQKDMVTRTLAGTLTRHYSNALLGLFTVKVHSGENTILNQQQESLTRWAKASNAQRKSMIRLSFVQDIVTYSLAALLIAHLVHTTSASSLNILYVYWLLQMPVRAEILFTVIQQYPGVKNIILRLQEPLCSAEDPIEEIEYSHVPENAKGMEIQATHASFSVESEPILNDVNIHIKPGTHIAIVGASGAGKSTFVSALLGFGKLDTGEVLIDGKPLNTETIAEVRDHSTWLDPQVYLFKNSIIENITYGSGHTGHMGEVLDESNLWPIIEGLPDSIHTDCGEGGSQLSGGEGQRIRLARALNKPEVRLALLDEPFRGLDKPTRVQLMKTVREKWKDITVICVIHDVSEALQFDQVAVFKEGQIVEQGDPKALVETDGALSRLIKHETAVASEWLNNPNWRRISVKDGKIVEAPRT
jgi:ABC-type bacteriocin/lantibiotic exporter with double-glycine peptidase domain